MTKKELIAEVLKAQAKRQLNDSRFAELLGIDNTLWSRLKSTERSPSLDVLRSIMRTLPELQLKVMDYITTTPEPVETK